MKKAKCPTCSKVIQLQEPTKIRDLITCPCCMNLLELVRNYPPTLDLVEDLDVCSPRWMFNKKY